MIPLGSCTMKLNATSEMIPVTWPEFGALHPFAPATRPKATASSSRDLERMLCAATGYAAVSLQPNAGSQGEYAGLLVIRAYHASRGEGHRDVCLIPASAHGTNPASAQMAGMRVVVVACDGDGNVDLADLEAKAREHRANLAAIMVTYPSTHGVFEAGIGRICEIVHAHGGQVYVDGANLNALVGLAAPGRVRRRRLAPQPAQDVLHSARRRRPGRGPDRRRRASRAVPAGASVPAPRVRTRSAAVVGRAVRLRVDPADLVDVHRDDGRRGLTAATESAILAANYIARRLDAHYPGALLGPRRAWSRTSASSTCGRSRRASDIAVDDVAKRLIDYGFHAPTMSFPVAGTLMIEPTESESKAELDRFIDAMIAIRDEIRAIEEGRADRADNVLKHAPHTAAAVSADDWPHAYRREQAAFPVACAAARRSTGRRSRASTTSTATATCSAAASRWPSTRTSRAPSHSMRCFRLAAVLLLALHAAPALAQRCRRRRSPRRPTCCSTVTSGQTIVAENADERRDPASLTKLMTAYLVVRRAARQDDHAVADRSRCRSARGGPKARGCSSSRGKRGLGRRAPARHDRAVRQRRVDRAGRARRRQRGRVRRADEREAARLGLANTRFANATGLSRSAALLDRGRPRPARRGADPRLSRVLPALFAERVPLQQHHAAQPQPAAVDRPLRRRREDRAHRRRGLVPHRLGEARRAAAGRGRAGRGVRRRAHRRGAEAAQLRLPGLRHRPALPVGQARVDPARVEGRRRPKSPPASSPTSTSRCRRARRRSSRSR